MFLFCVEQLITGNREAAAAQQQTCATQAGRQTDRCRLRFLLSDTARPLRQHLIHLETQKHQLPPSRSFLWSDSDPRSGRLQNGGLTPPRHPETTDAGRPGPALGGDCDCFPLSLHHMHSHVFLHMYITVPLRSSLR